MDYASYLRTPELLKLQTMQSEKEGKTSHDEMLFIIIHQTYELWFKQVLHELDLIQSVFAGSKVDDAKLGRAIHGGERIVKILQLLVAQIDVLETMTPMDFLEFRDLLIPSSGFQSEQFRLLEIRLGLRQQDRLPFNDKNFEAFLPPQTRDNLQLAESRPTLRSQVDEWLARTPFTDAGGFHFRDEYSAALGRLLDGDMQRICNHPFLSAAEKEVQLQSLENSRKMFDALLNETKFAELHRQGMWTMSRTGLQAALFLFLYRDEPAAHAGFRMLKALMDIDETLALWRLRHALMVSRMLGRKVGTGGSAGYDYLRATADKHRVFGDLFAMATFLIPRSALPALPDTVRKQMRYGYES